MSHDHLGLFDTPPDRRQVRVSLVVAGVQFAVYLLILPVRGVRLGEVNAFIPVVDAVMCLGDLITATLLYAQASVYRSRALSVLGAGYVYTALLFIPHALTFPGAFAPNGLLGAGVDTTAWLAFFRRSVFPIAVIVYAQLKRPDSAEPALTERPPAGIVVGVLAAIALAAAVVLLANYGQGLLPTYFADRADVVRSNQVVYESIEFALFALATAVLFRNRSSVLDMWLLVAFCGFLIQGLLNLTLHARFTAGWYGLYGMMLFSHLVVMLALIAESNRLYARLAVATAVRNRERYARLMSLDAVAAAISHEVGQPLTAIRLQAGLGRSRLASAPPDVKNAIKALDAIVDAEHRTSGVIKSIRAMFVQRPEGRTEFKLNDLVRATVLVMDRDLAAHQVSLQLLLDDALPPILADPVQIQRVLVNLLTNAIESLDATENRPRRITIRSEALDGREVLLEVSDNGGGISPEAMEQIFDVYFTTKATGIGIGLSLSRIIIEACGGRLWASRGEPCGATFHLQLPRSN